MSVKRIFVEKKSGFDIEAKGLEKELKNHLQIRNISSVRILYRYDIENINNEIFQKAKNTIFSEPPVDNLYEENFDIDKKQIAFAVEYLPGQFDQRADSAAQCIQILTQGKKPLVKCAKIYLFEGNISKSELNKIKNYLINPVESREASLEKPTTLEEDIILPPDVPTIEKFIEMNNEQLQNLLKEMGFAMDLDDLKFCRDYFKNTEKRNPTVTEMRILDTYWSDHCRHTTFLTKIDSVEFEKGETSELIKKVYDEYLQSRNEVYADRIAEKNICFMDIATLAMKKLKKEGKLPNFDESEEINACSIKVKADINGKEEDWLVMFKNETHNHPTEIEPFGGAATCLGGAIRDPLSGRAYVYQAMRVTGAADPRLPIEKTLEGKLPQRKITTEAANGYSSYGNQIGLSTGLVDEIYHPGYVAKRMEVGAVVAAAPQCNVVRKQPIPGDVVILLGGATGRDGCGGATGSSKAHTEDSLISCGAEVQKGNAPEERKIQRLFRNPNVTRLIKRCNDFGAGGVSVAIGELADGLEIQLDKIPKKYEGLDGTELAISESQERMACVVAKENEEKFIELAAEENLNAVTVAEVKAEPRVKMFWRGNKIVDITREFLNSNGATKHTTLKVKNFNVENYFENKFNPNQEQIKLKWEEILSDLNVCSKKGLIERFDNSVGASTVNYPFGGKYQTTPVEAMTAKLPVLEGDTTTGTAMSYGYDPFISTESPFHGAIYAVVESIAKLVASGADYRDAWFSFQEYFERLGNEPERWGKPFSALLGAFYAQMQFQLAAIGGKDSMSGSFKNLDVPPTLISFAISPIEVSNVISPEFKNLNSNVALIPTEFSENYLPDFEKLKVGYKQISKLISEGKIISAHTVKGRGISEAIAKMCFGNKIGFKFNSEISVESLFKPGFGGIIVELNKNLAPETVFEGINFEFLGKTIAETEICFGEVCIDINEAIGKWEAPLESIFPSTFEYSTQKIENYNFDAPIISTSKNKFAKPKVLIIAFPGTNSEYDSARAFNLAGGDAKIIPFKNLTAKMIDESIKQLANEINGSQILMLPGGFSAGDEPEGSGKFIATVLRNPKINEAVMDLLKNRDGLMLGICNGFQALIKLGLLPYGEIREITPDAPTLTFNKIGRHVAKIAYTKVVSNLSPWFSATPLNTIQAMPFSHGEGRFVANQEWIKKLKISGQIATQYVDFYGNPTYEPFFNPNGSVFAIEGITSADGRVLGKMGHNERLSTNVAKNIPGNKEIQLFKSGVNYFK